jgi:hypothetical protein
MESVALSRSPEVFFSKEEAFRSVRVGATAKIFDELQCSNVNLSVLKRQLPDGLEETLLRWVSRVRESKEQVISPRSFKLEPFGRALPEPAREWMFQDLQRLVIRFADVSGADRMRIVFGPVRSDCCRKFHADQLSYRLLCTYAGPGTEWVPNEAVNRASMVPSVGCPLEANARAVTDPSAIQHAAKGDVLIMKGDRHGPGCGLVHRSPPVEHLGLTRVVLVISAVERA